MRVGIGDVGRRGQRAGAQHGGRAMAQKKTWAETVWSGAKQAYLGFALIAAIALTFVSFFVDMNGWLAEFAREKPAQFLFLLLTSIFVAIAIVHGRMRRLETRVEDEVGQVRASLASSEFQVLGQLVEKLPAHAKTLAGAEVERLREHVRTVVSEDHLIIEGRDPFQSFWIRNIRRLQGKEIFATAAPQNEYFWEASEVEAALANFFDPANKNTMTRVFLLSSADLHKPDVFDNMQRQKNAGVAVHACVTDALSDDMVRYVLFDRALEFGWELQVRRGVNIAECRVEWRREAVEQFDVYRKTLMALPGMMTIEEFLAKHPRPAPAEDA